jgi:ribosomal protein S18 acetylase RimI-like enzyme
VTDHDISLRPVEEGDMDFLLVLYGTTREDELRRVPWTPEQKAAFVQQQFRAQDAYWRENYADTSWDLVLADGVPVGRLYVARWASEIRIVDIAVMPEHRGEGIGERLIRGIFAEGDASGRKVSIHVEQFNRARALYERLGFEHRGGGTGVYLLMIRSPAALPSASGSGV